MAVQRQEIMTAIGNRIRELRHRCAFSQEELALRSGLNTSYFGQVERGEKCPTIDTIYKIAEALQVSPTELLRTGPLPGNNPDYSRRIEELLARVPTGKVEQVLQIFENMVDLL